MDKRGVLVQCSCCYDLKDFRDGNVISKSSSQTNNIDNSLGIKRSRSLNDVTADLTDDTISLRGMHWQADQQELAGECIICLMF